MSKTMEVHPAFAGCSEDYLGFHVETVGEICIATPRGWGGPAVLWDVSLARLRKKVWQWWYMVP